MVADLQWIEDMLGRVLSRPRCPDHRDYAEVACHPCWKAGKRPGREDEPEEMPDWRENIKRLL